MAAPKKKPATKRTPPKLPNGKPMVANKVYNSTREGKKKMVYATKNGEGKLIHFGADGYKDYTQHGSEKRKKNYLARSGGIKDKNGNLTKDDRHSPNYWARKILW